MRPIPALILLAACSPGPSEDTLVDELRVIAAVTEPPEIAPGESTVVEVTIADPQMADPSVALWLCTPSGDAACAEAGTPLSERLSAGAVVDGSFTTELTVNPLWAALATEEPLATQIWVLSCEPGLCAPLDALLAAVNSGQATEELETLLATPTEWIADLPLTGVSLGAKQLAVSTRAVEDRNHNPTLSVDADLFYEPGEELLLDVIVDDSEDVVEVMGLSTAGGFGLSAFAILDGQALMRWYAPDEPAPVRLYAVASDGIGGTAVWTGDATVRAR